MSVREEQAGWKWGNCSLVMWMFQRASVLNDDNKLGDEVVEV